ncbi:MAG: hypothetical protein KAY65_07540, partial [Planctomycetes bacterium]|nr:hypothetical protein [Planctomycetota bacterium]
MKGLKSKLLFVCGIVLLMSAGPVSLGDWNEGDQYKMHYPQLPDREGWDVCVVDQWIGDDFTCAESGKITDIHFWISWERDQIGNPDGLQAEISIWSDRGSGPGAPLWTWDGVGVLNLRHYGTGQQGWVCPSTGKMQLEDHQNYFQINITQIPEPFEQKAGETYWLVVRVMAPPEPKIGWKTSTNEPPGPIWRNPAQWSTDLVNWQPVMTGMPAPQVHDMAFVITGEPTGPPPIERPTLRVADWLNPEDWHRWIGPHDMVPVQLQAVDPCDQIQKVEFSWLAPDGTWVVFATDDDGTEPREDTTNEPQPQGDGWSGEFDPSQVPPSGEYTVVQLKAEVFTVDSFFDVTYEITLDMTPPDSVKLNVEDWQVVEDDILTVDIDPILADIQYVVAYIEPKPEEYEKGIPKIAQRDPGHQHGGNYHCAPTAAAACLKYFEDQGDDEVCGDMNDFDLVEALAGLSGTNQGGLGTAPSSLANGLVNWIEDHGDGYTVRGPLDFVDFGWQQVRDELERSQDVLVGIYWPGGGGHRMTMNSIVNRRLPNGKMKVDFMDPWTGDIQYGELDTTTGWLTAFDSTSGNSGRLDNIIIVCPKEDDPGGGGGGNPQPGPDPDPIDIWIPAPGLYSLRVTVVDQYNHAATLIRVVEYKEKRTDFGDAPERGLAYPPCPQNGAFPTCINPSPPGWIQHAISDPPSLFFGPNVDAENEGNAGLCPTCFPPYDKDECFGDGDAGLIRPPSYTIQGPLAALAVVPCVASQTGTLGTVCTLATWGPNVDIHVTNRTNEEAYVNVLMDWDKSGNWGGASMCGPCSPTPGAVAREHVLINFPVPPGHSGPLSALMGAAPVTLMIGPNPGYVWTRFTVTPNPVGMTHEWTGEGEFRDGETEDYLLHVKPAPVVSDCDWNEGDEHKMHWPQLPDLEPTGVDVDMFWVPLADDFKCTEDGNITDIHFWGSFADDCLPAGGPGSLTFRVTLYSDIPAADSSTGYSMPGEPLRSWTFGPCDYVVRPVADSNVEDWYDPATEQYFPRNHFKAFQYNICINEDEAFEQKAGTIYWLEIKDIVDAVVEPDYTFGWKTTQVQPNDLRWNDDAVWWDPDMAVGWTPLKYPHGHPYAELENPTLDLAFVITGEAAAPPPVDWGDAPDPTYPTLAANFGASHVIVPQIYMGNTVDPDPDGQPSVAADGDDTDADGDDEDGVTFNTPLIPGLPAQITVNASRLGPFISVWIDYGGDGGWGEAQDYVVQSVAAANAGDNVFGFQVPGSAKLGRTYVRVRFTTNPGIGFAGPATNGEVEDHVVDIKEPYVPKDPVKHVKWSQPPIEINPVVGRVPKYCGWDEPSWTRIVSQPPYELCPLLAADDFRCLGRMPITSVHWWGSYYAWIEPELPPVLPREWRITFWRNVPPNLVDPFSQPGERLWQVDVQASQVQIELAGVDTDKFPDVPPDTCFQYHVKLPESDWFWQDRYVADVAGAARDTVFWISIQAIYDEDVEMAYPWGWKTRPWSWEDDAVRRVREPSGLEQCVWEPIEASPGACTELESFDLAFELDTDPNYIKWEQAFTGLRHWKHYEDVNSVGVEVPPRRMVKHRQMPDPGGWDVEFTSTLLYDDWKCTQTGPVSDIRFWFSSPRDGLFQVKTIRVEIHKSHPDLPKPWGRVWQRVFGFGDFSVSHWENGEQGWYDPNPPNPIVVANDHSQIWEAKIENIPEAFPQEEGNIYWLNVQVTASGPQGQVVELGWKTSVDHFGSEALWTTVGGGAFNPLRDPLTGEPLDLAFELTTETKPALDIERLVADDWPCIGQQPVNAIVWWGSYIGFRYEACQCGPTMMPRKPDYFLLQMWTDIPDPDPADPTSHSMPGEPTGWKFKAYPSDYDEVLVGFDKHPEESEPGQLPGREPVFRYSLRLPKEHWFHQRKEEAVYWLSIVAVYKDGIPSIPWGWTNHRHVYNDDAVVGLVGSDGVMQWRKLYDQTGIESVDMSFMLFTDPDCFDSSHPDYDEWVNVGKPESWC